MKNTLLAPLKHPAFRLLWAGMAASYAGDRLQELAQGWLVASLTQSSAMAVGWIGVLSAIPQLLMPLGGVVADRLDRRKLLIAGQFSGAAVSLVVGGLVLSGRVAPGHIYAWAVFSGFIWLVSRPAFKVIITQAVPAGLVRSAVALNSMSETLSMLVVNALGSLMVSAVGLPSAFILNTASYLAAGGSLWKLPELSRPSPAPGERFTGREILKGLWEGILYLAASPALLYPLLLTFLTMVVVAPAFSLLAALVHRQGGTITTLGLLGAASSLGSFLGAVYAGSRGEGHSPARLYALHGLGCAAALGLFILLPVGALTALPLAVVGFLLFSEAVWNTSRVRLLAAEAFQARLQSITTMAFTLGGALGALWGGAALDRLGQPGLWIGAGLLTAVSLGFLMTKKGAGSFSP